MAWNGLNLNLAPKKYRWYVDDTHARFKSKEQSHKLENISNKQNKQTQFTTEDEKEEKMFRLSWPKIKNSKGRYEFDVYRKQVLMNIQIKPHSCIPSSTFTSIFKAFLAKATKICSEKCLRVEIEYLADMFCENGYNRKMKTN